MTRMDESHESRDRVEVTTRPVRSPRLGDVPCSKTLSFERFPQSRRPRDRSYELWRTCHVNQAGQLRVENVYEEALAYEFEIRGIPFERQKEVVVRYKKRVVGQHRLDLVVDRKIVLELKAVSALNDVFKQQTLSYLKATGLRLGILINFGTPRVEYVCIAN